MNVLAVQYDKSLSSEFLIFVRKASEWELWSQSEAAEPHWVTAASFDATSALAPKTIAATAIPAFLLQQSAEVDLTVYRLVPNQSLNWKLSSRVASRLRVVEKAVLREGFCLGRSIGPDAPPIWLIEPPGAGGIELGLANASMAITSAVTNLGDVAEGRRAAERALLGLVELLRRILLKPDDATPMLAKISVTANCAALHDVLLTFGPDSYIEFPTIAADGREKPRVAMERARISLFSATGRELRSAATGVPAGWFWLAAGQGKPFSLDRLVGATQRKARS